MVEQRDLLKTDTAANSRTSIEDGALGGELLNYEGERRS